MEHLAVRIMARQGVRGGGSFHIYKTIGNEYR
jgi:hypothetical protein